MSEQTTSGTERSVEERVQEILDDEIKPAVQMDGGDISLVSVENGRVLVQLSGACTGCPSSQVTLKMGVERRLKQLIPEIESVDAV